MRMTMRKTSHWLEVALQRTLSSSVVFDVDAVILWDGGGSSKMMILFHQTPLLLQKLFITLLRSRLGISWLSRAVHFILTPRPLGEDYYDGYTLVPVTYYGCLDHLKNLQHYRCSATYNDFAAWHYCTDPSALQLHCLALPSS
jgi:hypothetical protein